MNIFYLGNNWLGWRVAEWLTRQGENIVGMAIHAPENQQYTDEMIEASEVSPDCLFKAEDLRDDATLDAIADLNPDIGISVLFGHILKPSFLGLFSRGCVNLHPAYLPYNRGSYPNVWSIIDETPAGVTLHRIDEEIDTGDILSRRRVDVRPSDTGETLYRRLEQAGLDLFKEAWPALKDGTLSALPQPREEGTYHVTADVAEIDEIDLDATYKARDLINILRARTFPPYQGAYFLDNGRKVYIRVELTEER